MKDINQKSMNGIISPQQGGFRREGVIHSVHNEPSVNTINTPSEKREDRIEGNPFFEKGWTKTVEKKNVFNQKRKIGTRPIIWFLILLLISGVGFGISNYFSSALITIKATTRAVIINSDFTATKDGTLDDLPFKTMSIEEEESRDIPSTLDKKIQKKASGKVIIYNAYSGEQQRLIKNTRLESLDHKIFRIDESVVVPGAKMVNGKVGQPGAVEAVVYADVPGKEYNIGLSDFTIPGFKGDPRYSKFTARSKPEAPLSGGFSGAVKVPSDEAIVATQEEIKDNLKNTAIEKARAQIPPEVSFFPGSMVLKFEEVPQEFSTDSSMKVVVRAIVTVFFFDTPLLVKKLTEASSLDVQGGEYSVPSMSSLVFSFIDPVESVVFSDLTKIRFHVAGNILFVGKIDDQNIKTVLIGKEKKDFGKLIANEHNVAKAEAVIRPMWKTVFPKDTEKIVVKVVTN